MAIGPLSEGPKPPEVISPIAAPPGAWIGVWPRGERPPDFHQPVRSDRPALLLSGELEYFQQHWPATGAATLRIDTYRLPAGARVLETVPADMTRRQISDGRLQLRTHKIIPPNDSITVRIRFRQPPQ